MTIIVILGCNDNMRGKERSQSLATKDRHSKIPRFPLFGCLRKKTALWFCYISWLWLKAAEWLDVAEAHGIAIRPNTNKDHAGLDEMKAQGNSMSFSVNTGIFALLHLCLP